MSQFQENVTRHPHHQAHLSIQIKYFSVTREFREPAWTIWGLEVRPPTWPPAISASTLFFDAVKKDVPWVTHAIPIPKRPKQENSEFKASLCYRVRSCLNTSTHTHNHTHTHTITHTNTHTIYTHIYTHTRIHIHGNIHTHTYFLCHTNTH